ncbi:MAG: hypothetical protein ABSC93_15080 [Bryobacteraceae bacterium]|jgi:hypothetical protein
MANTSVQVAIGGGAAQTFTTDAQGQVTLHTPPGASVVVQVADTQEAAAGQSTTTASGKHFGLNKPGP